MRNIIIWHERVKWNFWSDVKDWAELRGMKRLSEFARRHRV